MGSGYTRPPTGTFIPGPGDPSPSSPVEPPDTSGDSGSGVNTDLPTQFRNTYHRGQVVKYTDGYYYRVIADSTNSAPTDASTWEKLSSTPTDLNPFAAAGDYPDAIGFYQNRLLLASTRNRPNTVWGSAIGVYFQFYGGSYDNDPFQFTLLSDKAEAIQWIDAKDALVLGTASSEWVMTGGSSKAITPTSVDANRQTTFGSNYVSGRVLGENVIFVQRGGHKVREYYYLNELQAYHARDLTGLSDHITSSGIVDMEYQSDPHPVLWFVRNDGVLLALSYDTTNDVLAWSRIVTDGVVETIGVTPNDGEDQVWLIVKRTINGETKRYIELFSSFQEPDDQRDYFFVDCGVTVDGGDKRDITAATNASPVEITSTAHGLSTDDVVRFESVDGMVEINGQVYKITKVDDDHFTLNNTDGADWGSGTTSGKFERVYNSVSGLDFLEGETVSILTDGGAHAAKTVTDGTVDLNTKVWANTIQIGLPYTGRIKTMRIEAGAHLGTAQGKTKRAFHTRILFYNTIGASVGTDDDNIDPIQFRSAASKYGNAPAPFTGYKSKSVRSGYDRDGQIIIEQDQPLPCTVLAIVPDLTVHEGAM